MMTQKRRILLKNANNFRDLGGYPVPYDNTTAWGKLFRTETLSYLCDDDWSILRENNIKTLIDLRGAEEASENPVSVPGDFTYRNLPLISSEVTSSRKSAGSSMLASLIMRYSYIFSHSLKEISAILHAISSGLDSGSVAFFCSGGKDRTGMISAILLHLCGVPDDDIIADYSITRIYDSNPERGVYAKLMSTVSDLSGKKQLPDEMLRSDPETMEDLLKFFHENDIFHLLDKHGFSYESQNELKGKMIE